MTKNKVWFVTGASQGLGLALVKKLLTQGFKVAATSRSIAVLEKEVAKKCQFFTAPNGLIQRRKYKRMFN